MSHDTHAHQATPSAHSSHDESAHIKVYKAIGFTLLVLTLVTVGASYIDLSVAPAILLALAIASFKGYLVAGHFMHLTSEKKIIYLILILTVIFFAAVMLLPVASEHNSLVEGVR